MSGCAVVEPLVQDFNIVSVPEEIQIGNKMSAEVARQMPVVRDPLATRSVSDIGMKLVAALPRQDFQYHFYLIRDNTPNAFTIPGGTIYVHTGLLDFADDKSELAGVLAHEISHAFDRHPAKALSRELGAQYLSSLLFRDPQSRLRSITVRLAQGGILTRYSREDELRADELGYYLLRRAGFRTDGLLRFLRKLQSIDTGSAPLAFLSTHPPTPERIARLEALERGNL